MTSTNEPVKQSTDNVGVLTRILDQYPDSEFVMVTGYNDCVVGICDRAGNEPFLLYDREKLLEQTCEQEGWTMDEAVEWHEFNTFGAWYGDMTPGFMTVPHE
tara:strand:+ start:554 stop:859 length:306 start_codon:yes stop_codon:yes gene_type:complete